MQLRHPDLELVRINAEAKQFFIYVMSIPSNPDYRACNIEGFFAKSTKLNNLSGDLS